MMKKFKHEHLTVGRNTIVHVAYGDLPRCDTGIGARGGVSGRKTGSPVTCKRCLRIIPTANDTIDEDVPRQSIASRLPQRTCTCECVTGGFCGGCGHAGCGRR